MTALLRLTTLTTRQEFLRAAEEQVGTVVSIDLAGTRWANDVLGHVETDEILVRLAGLIASACPPGTPFLRAGGDEFAVLLPGRDLPMAVIERIRNSVEQEFREERARIRAGASDAGVIPPRPDLLTAQFELPALSSFR